VNGFVNADDAGPNAPTGTVVIQLAFDRVLNPITVNRQSFVLVDAQGNAVSVGPVIRYDPIARVVRMEASMGSGWLDPGQVYAIQLGIPPVGSLSGGVRAFDGATLDPNLPASARIVEFQTCPAAGCADGAVAALDPPDPVAPDFCRDILPVFSNHCGGGVCHGSIASATQLPAEGLILDSYAGVVNTAIGRSSQESNTGPLSGVAESTGVFGLDMPIIDPTSPATSWIIYKMLLAPTRALLSDGGDPSPSVRFLCSDGGLGDPPVDPFQDGDGGTLSASAAPFTVTSDGERALLDNYILGQAMPYPTSPGTAQTSADPGLLSFDEMERIQAWIAAGATTYDCGSCQP
jgi:hypothetical protein